MLSANSINGFIVIDKPAGMTSRDVVDQVQSWFPQSKLGHAGTLDPAATGVLIIGVGSTATRLIEYIQNQPKTYVTTIRLGGTSSTDDAEGEIIIHDSIIPPSEQAIRTALQSFTGTFQQTPPAFSAAKVQGVRAHTKARRGEKVELQPREVTVHEMRMLNCDYPDLQLEIRCSKGTYIRSIARDLGTLLGTGGYVQTLRRTRIGDVTCEHAVTLKASSLEAVRSVLPLTLAVSHLARQQVSTEEALRLQQGQLLRISQEPAASTTVGLWHHHQFIGVGQLDHIHQVLKPVKMIQMDINRSNE